MTTTTTTNTNSATDLDAVPDQFDHELVAEQRALKKYVYDDGTPTPYGWRLIVHKLSRKLPTKMKPGGERRPALPYITARQAQDLLDEVVGPGNWSTSYRIIDAAAGAVECTVTIFGVSKSDIGLPNSPEDQEPESWKSSYTDAFKRACVHWGIGRFLRKLPDPQP